MKNILFLLAFAFAANTSFAQHESIENFYTKYMDIKEVSDITLEGWLLNMAVSQAAEDDASKILSSITKLRVMVMEEQNVILQADKKELVKGLRNNQFEELIKVRDGDSKVDIMFRENGDTITNVLLLIDDFDSFILLSLEGNLNWEDLRNINIEVDGSEHLKKIPKNTSPRA